MNLEIVVYTLLLIIVGALLAGLEFAGKLEHKLTTADFLVNLVTFLFTLVLAEIIKSAVKRVDEQRSGMAAPRDKHLKQ